MTTRSELPGGGSDTYKNYLSRFLFNNVLVSGLVYDGTGYYAASFYLGGGAAVIGAMVLIPALKNSQSVDN